ncbi:MAG: hypothetical protein MI810_14780 [Flavobacteriales bacterium]|nr:hypothetical protein [Flavobacteriales bacterium]
MKSLDFFESIHDYIRMTTHASYKLVIDPELELDANDFAKSWNSISECTSTAEVKIDSQRFDPGLCVTQAALIGIASSVASGLIIELVKRALDRADLRQKLKKSKEPQVVIREENGIPIILVKPPSDE